MSSTLEASVSWERITQTIYIPSKIWGENLTLKQMFDIPEKLIVGQSDEIFGVSQISWESFPWKQSSLVNDEEVISLSHAKVYVFCLNNACMNDVHMTSPHDSSRPRSRNHKGLALWWLITLDESSPQWVPARTPTVHWGRYDGRHVGGPNNAPKGEVTRHDASLKQDNRQVFRQTW